MSGKKNTVAVCPICGHCVASRENNDDQVVCLHCRNVVEPVCEEMIFLFWQ
jgi:hypothetical protein